MVMRQTVSCDRWRYHEVNIDSRLYGSSRPWDIVVRLQADTMMHGVEKKFLGVRRFTALGNGARAS